MKIKKKTLKNVKNVEKIKKTFVNVCFVIFCRHGKIKFPLSFIFYLISFSVFIYQMRGQL